MGKVEATYESEHTKFMREWMEQNPQELDEQRKGRALWWDKPQKPETTEGFEASEVPAKAYYYQTEA